MDIEDIIEEKYTKYLNCEVDYLDLTIEEAKHILANDRKEHFVDDLLYEAYKVVLNELQKKDKVINEMAKEIADITGSCPYDKYDYGLDCEEKCKHDRETECWKEYFTNKAENVGE